MKERIKSVLGEGNSPSFDFEMGLLMMEIKFCCLDLSKAFAITDGICRNSHPHLTELKDA